MVVKTPPREAGWLVLGLLGLRARPEERELIAAFGFDEACIGRLLRMKTLPGMTKSKPLKQPFYVTNPDGKPLTFAGLWEKWKDGLLSATILTTDASDGIRDLHGLMPLILDEQGIENWLSGKGPELSAAVSQGLKFHAVSPKMNKPAYNAPDCIASSANV